MSAPTTPTSTTPAATTAPAPASKPTFSGGMVLAILMVGIILILLAGGKKEAILSKLRNEAPPQPLPCGNVFADDDAGTLNHASELVDHFDVPPTNNCLGSRIFVPTKWRQWGYRFVDPKAREHKCQVWFWYPNHAQAFGPFGPDDTADFYDYPYGWRVATNCTLLYYNKGPSIMPAPPPSS